MKNLYIVGARGFGREVYNLAKESEGYETEFKIAGFLDDKADALAGYEGYPEIAGSVEEFIPAEDDVVVVALGDVRFKKKYVDVLLEKGAEFYTLVHRDAYISQNVKIGRGCIVCANARISCDIEIGDFNTFQPFCLLGHDVRIGDYCQINSYAFMGGFAVIEDCVTLHTGAIIHPHKRVKSGAVVGAGAVVIRNVAENTTVYGNPARKLEL